MILRTYVMVRNMLSCKKGQGLMEYALLALLIAIALIATVIYFREALVTRLTEISDTLLSTE